MDGIREIARQAAEQAQAVKDNVWRGDVPVTVLPAVADAVAEALLKEIDAECEHFNSVEGLQHQVRRLLAECAAPAGPETPAKCPTCESPNPNFHPATSQGEVTKICADAWHQSWAVAPPAHTAAPAGPEQETTPFKYGDVVRDLSGRVGIYEGEHPLHSGGLVRYQDNGQALVPLRELRLAPEPVTPPAQEPPDLTLIEQALEDRVVALITETGDEEAVRRALVRMTKRLPVLVPAAPSPSDVEQAKAEVFAAMGKCYHDCTWHQCVGRVSSLNLPCALGRWDMHVATGAGHQFVNGPCSCGLDALLAECAAPKGPLSAEDLDALQREAEADERAPKGPEQTSTSYQLGQRLVIWMTGESKTREAVVTELDAKGQPERMRLDDGWVLKHSDFVLRSSAVAPPAQEPEMWCVDCQRQPDTVCSAYKHTVERKWPNGDPLESAAPSPSDVEQAKADHRRAIHSLTYDRDRPTSERTADVLTTEANLIAAVRQEQAADPHRVPRPAGADMTLRDQMKSIDGGRFIPLVNALTGICDECEKCAHFRPELPPGQGYRCRCLGTCPAATLHPDAISYIHWKLGWKSEADHLRELGLR